MGSKEPVQSKCGVCLSRQPDAVAAFRGWLGEAEPDRLHMQQLPEQFELRCVFPTELTARRVIVLG